MGHLINPISNRISINYFWNSTWTLNNNFNYVNVFKRDFLLFQFLDWFSKKSKFGKLDFINSHYKIFRLNDGIFVNFYYHNIEKKRQKDYKLKLNSLFSLLKINLKEEEDGLYINELSSNKEDFYLIPDENLLIQRLENLHFYVSKLLIVNLYWYLMQYSLSIFLKSFDYNSNKIFINVYNLNDLNLTSNLIASYVSLRLQQKYSLNWVLLPILKDLNLKISQKLFIGYKIVCSGRFTRKQIATYMWMKKGPLSLNQFSNYIKYSEALVRLKYGQCGIKVWLNYGSINSGLFPRNLSLIYPVFVPFKYVLDLKTNVLAIYINYWYYSYIKVRFLKSYYFSFYKSFIELKMKILLSYLLKKLFNNIYNKNFKITYEKDNKLSISLSQLKSNKFD